MSINPPKKPITESQKLDRNNNKQIRTNNNNARENQSTQADQSMEIEENGERTCPS